MTTFYFVLIFLVLPGMHVRLKISSFSSFSMAMIPWCKVEALHLNLSNCTELQDLGTEKEIGLQCLVDLTTNEVVFIAPNIHGRKCRKIFAGLRDLK